MKSALLLVDFINLLDFDGAQRLAPRAIAAAKRTTGLKAWAKRQRIPCIYVNDNFGDWKRPFDSLVQACEARGGAARTLVRLLAPAQGDVPILKPRHSGFYGTPLEFLLEEIGVRRLIVTGLAADNCVFATAQDGYVRKFAIWVPRDCIAAETPAIERSVLAHMKRTLKADTKSSQEHRTARAGRN
jgi:nicotinamidase-related amidase